jgi:hypothetical protein
MAQLKSLNPNNKNPRKITDEKLDLLKKSLVEFGDLSGIIFNKRLNRLVGGHQRKKAIPEEAQIIIEKKYSAPTPAGTVAEGYVTLGEERIRYREVEWDNEKDYAANIAANKHGGDWDILTLNEILLDLDASNYDLSLTGFTDKELEGLLAPIGNPSEENVIDNTENVDFSERCPHCGESL